VRLVGPSGPSIAPALRFVAIGSQRAGRPIKMPAIDSQANGCRQPESTMKNTLTTRLAALALALFVSASVFAAIDHLAVIQAAAPIWAGSPVAAHA
jgi:hypothetical protein